MIIPFQRKGKMIWVEWAFNLRHFTAWFEPFYRAICIISSREMHKITQ